MPEPGALARCFDSLADRIQREWRLCLAFFCFFVLIGLLPVAMRDMWFDELLVFHISRLPSMAAIWSALTDGVVFDPPLLYFLTRASHSVFGAGPVATRLPAMLGFTVMLLCLFRFMLRRHHATYAFAAALFPMLTAAYYYGAEARPYGVVLGFSGLALIAWQAAAEDRRRAWNLPLLAISLMGAILTHGYAAMVLLPFAVGEMVRDYRRRRVDWGVWAAIAAALPALGVYLPILGTMRTFALDSTIFQPGLFSIPQFYVFLLGPAAFALIAGFAMLAIARRGEGKKTESDLPIHELACAVTFAVIPFVAEFLALTITHVFMNRYGLTSVIGISILIAASASYSAQARRAPGSGMALLFLACFLVNYCLPIIEADKIGMSRALPKANLASLDLSVPLVMSNGVQFLEADHYGGADTVSRMYYLHDEHAALAYTHGDILERTLGENGHWLSLRSNVCEYSSFVHQHTRFLVFGPYDYPNDWLIQKLADDGAEVKLLGEYSGRYGTNLLLEVSTSGAAFASPSVSGQLRHGRESPK